MSEFQDSVGKEFDFYGAAENQFRIGDTTWLVVEDECDGYRSCLGEIKMPDGSTTILFNAPIARVRIEDRGDIYVLVDTTDGHVWLQFGTDNADDYYPGFVFDYSPKEPNAAGGRK